MPKWIQLPSDQLKYNPYQDAFWKAHRQRICKTCQIEYDCPPHNVCPQCKQRGDRRYHRLTLLAGRRGGKTKAASIATVEEICVPNSIVWACAPTNPKLHRYVIPAIQQLVPPDWVSSWSSEFLDLRLRNGSLLHFQTLEDPDQGRGQGLDAVWIDEVCELTDDHWNVLRPSLTERRGAAIFSSSPRSFDWVWENFYRTACDCKGTCKNPASPANPTGHQKGVWACRYSTSENPIISAEEIADAKATMPPTMFQQEYEADFVVFTGAVYGGQIEDQILRTPSEIKTIIPEWPDIAPWRQILVGLDTGADHPFGAVKIVSSENGLVVIGEYLERHRTFVQHAGSIKMLAANNNTRYAINKNERQPMMELAQHGIFCQAAENDQVAGIQRVASWLQAKQLWFVEGLCPMTIRQMKSLRWAPDKTKDGQVRKEKVFKKEDELPDCVRYALMTWPTLPKIPVNTNTQRDITKLPDEMQAAIQRMRKIDAEPVAKPRDITGDFWL